MNPTQSSAAPQGRPADLELFVAPDGDDAGPGTLERPFATLIAARDAIRRRSQRGGCTVCLREGIYPLRASFKLCAEDSGRVDAPIIYRARPGEKVCVT